jgi:hypothetical protein
MPIGGDLKKIVRDRVAVTGEKYTTALRAVLEAARAAVPRDDPVSRVAGLTGQDLGDFIVRYLDAAVTAGQDGSHVMAVLADLCEYQSGWRQEKAKRYKADRRNLDASRHLAACANELKVISPEDPRVLVIAYAWSDSNIAGLMQDLDQDLIDWIYFDLTGERLIDLLARKAVQWLLDPEGS